MDFDGIPPIDDSVFPDVFPHAYAAFLRSLHECYGDALARKWGEILGREVAFPVEALAVRRYDEYVRDPAFSTDCVCGRLTIENDEGGGPEAAGVIEVGAPFLNILLDHYIETRSGPVFPERRLNFVEEAHLRRIMDFLAVVLKSTWSAAFPGFDVKAASIHPGPSIPAFFPPRTHVVVIRSAPTLDGSARGQVALIYPASWTRDVVSALDPGLFRDILKLGYARAVRP